MLNAGAENYASWDTAAPVKSWTPIGISSNPFSGTFDGDGHTISGIYINSVSNYQGLFGYVKNGMVKNVGVTQSYIKGKNYVGGVVGNAVSPSTITNCYNTGTVRGVSDVGGVVGYTTGDSANSYCYITDCYNTGFVGSDVTATAGGGIGGVVGAAQAWSKITDCYNAGTVSGNGGVGGIAGEVNNYSEIDDCYNIGLVVGQEDKFGTAGGITGNVTLSTVTDCYNTGTVEGNGNVGGVAANILNSSAVTNCYNTGSLTASGEECRWNGGVAGHVSESNVTDCYNTGSLTVTVIGSGFSYVGGVAGHVTESNVTDCYSTGSVTFTGTFTGAYSSERYVGGITGYVYGSTVTNCYYNGPVTASVTVAATATGTVSDSVGGVAGTIDDSSTVTNCYYNGSVTGTGTVSDSVGGVAGIIANSTVTNCYYLVGSADNAIGTLGNGTAKTDTFNTAGVLTSENNTGITANTTKLLTALNAWVTANQTTPASYSSWTENFFPVLSDVWHATIGFAGGDGTESDPYTIETVEQLKYFAYQVNAGITFYTGQYIKLAANLVLNAGAENYATWGTTPPANTWTPIGIGRNILFMGTFDGDGHTISGIYINSASAYQGLFGYVREGTIKNVGVTQSYIKGENYVGGVVGRTFSSPVFNCYNTGEVVGTGSAVGGVVGSTDTCKTTNCYNTGSVSGTENVGGVVGYNYFGQVFNCYNAGSVSGSGYNVGGVVGNIQYSNVSNCYNTGSVSGSGNASENVGGIVGVGVDQSYSVKIMNCYNTGTVTGNADVGGIVGDFIEGVDKLTNCYYLEGSATEAIGNLNLSRDKLITDTFNDSGVLTSEKNNGKNGVSITANSTTVTEALLTCAKNFNLSNSKSTAKTPFSKAWAVMSPGEAKPVLVSQTLYPSYTITYKIGGDFSEIVFNGTHADGYPLTHTYGTATTLQGLTATPLGFTDFGGWFADKACTGTALTTLGATDYEADITLYAKLTAIPATAATITVQPTGGTTPYGTGKALSITATEPSAHGLSYQWYSNTANSNTGGTAISGATSNTFTTPTAENVGTKYYYCVVTSTRYDNALGTTTISDAVSVQVIKADPSLTAPTPKTDLVYNKSEQQLINAGITDGGTMQYSLDDITYSTAIPTATDAGTYTVFCKVVGDTNHNNSAAGRVDVTIGKADYDMSGVTFENATAEYDGNAHSVVIGGTLPTGVDNIQVTVSYSGSATNVADGAVTVTATFATTSANYNTPAEMTATITITEGVATLNPAPGALNTAYNGRAQVLVTEGIATNGTLMYKLDNGTYSTAIPTATDAGTYTVYYKAVGDTNYGDIAEASVTVTISTADSTLDTAPAANTLSYNGRAQVLVTEGIATNGTLMYKLDNGTYSTAIPTATDAGTYTVYYKVVGDTNYGDIAEASVTVTISTADSTLDTAPAANTLSYNGRAQALVTAGTATNGTLMYKLGNGTYSTDIPTATDAGTYTVYYKVVGDTNYGDIAEASVTVTITVLYSTLDTAPAANTLTYTGSAQALVTAGTATNGTVMYKLGSGTYSTDIPTATDAGTYTVYYKVAGDTNYNDVAEASVTVTITVLYSTLDTAPAANTLTYTGSAQALVTAGTATNGTVMYKLGNGTYSTDIPTATDAGTYTVYYKVAGDTNYNDTDEASVEVRIAKVASTVAAPTANTLTYNGSAQELVTAGSTTNGTLMYRVGEGDYSTSIPTATEAGNYTVYYKVVGGANHNDYVGTGITVTIGKADYDMSGISFTNATVAYDGNAHSIEIGGTLPTGADGIDLTVDYIGSASNVSDGEVTVTATFSTTSANYNVPAEMTATIRVTESASAITTAPTANTLTYNKTAQALVTTGTATHGTVMYKLGDGTYSVAVPTATNAGTYTVYYKVIGDENHSDVAEESVTVTIAKADYDMSGITFEDATLDYDGNPHSISIDGTLPEGVTVTYIANTLQEAGSVSVTATFEGDTENYNKIPDMTATLTVVEQDTPPDEGEGDIAKPVIIAFASAVTLGGLAWLVIVLLKKRK